MRLHHQFFSSTDSPSSKTPLIIIHGLFGSGSNWRSMARALAAELDVYVIDLRNHGASPHKRSNTFDDMVADLLAFVEQQSLPSVHICGHSLGGKVAMAFSLQYPKWVERLAVLDIAPVAYDDAHTNLINALLQLDLAQVETRRQADQQLQTDIPETAVRMFLLQSLRKSENGYVWNLNLPVLKKFMPELVSFPGELLTNYDFIGKALFLRGTRSDYVQAKHHARIKRLFPKAQMVDIEGGDHWLHVSQAEKVKTQLQKFFTK